ncbi:MAG: hypothetical protein R2764_08860 [Bacteroidales bacterium]
MEVTNQMGCIARDTIVVNFAPSPQIDIGNDTLFCQGTHLFLNAGAGFTSYNWSDGSGNQILIVEDPGIYWWK